ATFTPTGDAKEFMQMAAAPLSVNLEEAGLALQDPNRLSEWLEKQAGKGLYTLVRVENVEGADNHPPTSYRLLLSVKFPGPSHNRQEAFRRVDEVTRRVNEDFGNLLGSRVVTVRKLQYNYHSERDTMEVEVTTAPSRLTKRLWKHNFSILFGLV